jgi:hypothetical protein
MNIQDNSLRDAVPLEVSSTNSGSNGAQASLPKLSGSKAAVDEIRTRLRNIPGAPRRTGKCDRRLAKGGAVGHRGCARARRASTCDPRVILL